MYLSAFVGEVRRRLSKAVARGVGLLGHRTRFRRARDTAADEALRSALLDGADAERLAAAVPAAKNAVLAARTAAAEAERAAAALPSAVEVFRTALAAGIETEKVAIGWLDVCLDTRDFEGMREAVRVSAIALGTPVGDAWTWRHALQASVRLRALMHIKHFYLLEEACLAEGDVKGADVALMEAARAKPTLSGPILRLSQRALDAGEVERGGRLLADFLERFPGDLHAALHYARLSLSEESDRRRSTILPASVAAGIALDSVMGAWLTACLKAGNFDAVERAILSMRSAIGVSDKAGDAKWPDVMLEGASFMRALHITDFYKLDERLAAGGDWRGAETVLRTACRVYPKYSGPVLKLAERYMDRDNFPGAERVVAEFLRSHPEDVAAKQFLSIHVKPLRSASKRSGKAKSPKQYERLSRRIDVCVAGLRKKRLKARALPVLVDLLERTAMPLDQRCVPALPHLFARAAFDAAASRRLVGRLAKDVQIPAGPAYGFVRGVIALDRRDFRAARAEFRAFAERFPEDSIAAAANEHVSAIGAPPYDDPDFLRLADRPDRYPDLSAFAGKRVLILTDALISVVDDLVAALPPTTTSTVVVCHSRHYERKGPAGHHYDIPGLYVWYSEHGKAAHKLLESLSDAIQRRVRRRIDQFKNTPKGLSLYINDMTAYAFAAVSRFEKLLKTEQWDAVLVLSRGMALYQVARDIVPPSIGPDNLHIAWTERPTLKSPPWPTPDILRAPFRDQVTRRQPRAHVERSIVHPSLPGRRSRPYDGVPPALVVWSIGEGNYNYSLRRLLRVLTRIRPVIVFLYGDADHLIVDLRSDLDTMLKDSPFGVQIVRFDDFLRMTRHDPSGIARRGCEAILGAADDIDGGRDGGAWETSFMRRYMVQAVGHAHYLRAMAAVLRWLEGVVSAVAPAYMLTAPGRSPLPASMAELAQANGVPATDIHLYFLADSARQLRPPHQYIATIDSVLDGFLKEMWKLKGDEILRVGYLWQRPAAPVLETPLETVAAHALAKRKVLLLATQPAPMELTIGFMEAFFDILISEPDCGLLLKPHGKETPAAVDYYREIVQKKGLSDRTAMIDATIPILPLIERADIVVTRTSNVGLEAAQRYKPVVRGVFLDTFLPKVWLRMEYALNAMTPEEMATHIKSLLHSEDALHALRKQQELYFAKNPSLIDAQGPERLVEFMEDLYAKRKNSAVIESVPS